MICLRKLVKVDGKVRTSAHFPAGFMDTLQIPRSGDNFRLLYDTKGRFVLNRITEEDARVRARSGRRSCLQSRCGTGTS